MRQKQDGVALRRQGAELLTHYQGRVSSFKAPSAAERDHGFLCRHAQRLPARAGTGILNRSRYEEVLVVRVHPEYLSWQKIPGIWKQEQRARFPRPQLAARLDLLADAQEVAGWWSCSVPVSA